MGDEQHSKHPDNVDVYCCFCGVVMTDV